MNAAYRQSALLLHGLGEFDRKWILEQLAEDQRARLKEYLAELRELGLPSDRSLTETMLAGKSGSINAHGHVLRSASADVMLQLLKSEPAWLCTRVLAIESWPWGEAVFNQLSQDKPGLRWPVGDKAPPLRLAQALVRQLENQLAAADLGLDLGKSSATEGSPVDKAAGNDH